MGKVEFILLFDLLNKYPEQVENIKQQYLLLLSELTSANCISTELFLNNVERIHQIGKIIIGIINHISDKSYTNIEIVASGTIIIEPKIIRDGKNVGHIEDIVVKKRLRGKGISQEILHILKTMARENNCYKVILDCDYAVKDVYIKNGFAVKGLQMVEYF
jgi:glucosamine-phosphate N-acetyltransferase